MTTRPKIYLHWSATPYTWVQPNHYHTIVTGDGKVNRLHDYNIDLTAHTYKRNTNSIGIACACMGGQSDPWSMSPTDEQIQSMCEEVAQVIKRWGWKESDISVRNILTHAEAASNKDGIYPHDNYGPVPWGGTGERWDFMTLKKNGPDNGGDLLREKIASYFNGQTPPGIHSNSLGPTATSTMKARGHDLKILIDDKGTSWAKAADLLNLYEIPFEWNAGKRRILLGATDIVPKYLQDQVHPSGELPSFEMALQGGNSPIILIGLIRDNQSYCRVLEFAEELGITVTFDPFKLGERQGG